MSLLGTWMAGGVVVPMHYKHPSDELQYYADQSESSLVIAHPDFYNTATALNKLVMTSDNRADELAGYVDVDAEVREVLVRDGRGSGP